MSLVMTLAYAAVVVTATLGRPAIFAVAVVAAACGEAAVALVAPVTPRVLAGVGLTSAWRWAVMSLSLLLLVMRSGAGESTGLAVLVVTTWVAMAAALIEGLARLVEYWRKSPVLSSNLPLDDLDLPRSPRWLLRWRGGLLWPAQLVLVLGTAASVAGDDLESGTFAAWLALALTVVAIAHAGVAARRARTSHIREVVPVEVQQAVDSLAPEVVLYYGGDAAARYQVEMWLATFESAPQRTIVLLRDREAWRQLRATTLPALCIPAATVLTSFDLGTVRAALFVANGSTNIHLLRMGGMRTAFIGHGDSDKASSSNPFVKVYDEIWVAGPAGAMRYRNLHDGVRDRIHLVGLPQAGVQRARTREPGTPLTVLYAPTWEGWGGDSNQSSLARDGVDVVRTLLGSPEVRVVYRPHPLTGTRDSKVRRAHREVVSLLRNSGAPRERSGAPWRPACDDVDRMFADEGKPARRGGGGARHHDAAEDFWRGKDPEAPRIAQGPVPGLESCFEHADLLVTDVSGVVSDWLVHDRPLAVTNPAGLAPEELRRTFPSSSAGTVLGPSGEGLSDLVDRLRRGDDLTASARAEARRHLLGGQVPDAFTAALSRITAPDDADTAGATNL